MRHVVLLSSFLGLWGAGGAAVPGTMRAAILSSRSWDMKVHVDRIEVADLPVPKPGLGQVLVQVRGSSVNPVDMQLLASPLELLWRYPHTLGFDVSGVVVSHGPGCSSRLAPGDEVYAQMGTLVEAANGGGAWAEYAVVAERVLAKKPRNMNFTEAAALPMVSLTGLLNLEWAADPQTKRLDNMTVVVLGGSGGTGHVGIQIAKALGAREVITTCGTDHVAFVMALGADRVFDYHEKLKWYDVLSDQSVDVVYDCMGFKGTGDKAFPKLKIGGRYASLESAGLAGREAKRARPDIKQRFRDCIVDCVQHDRLEKLTKLVEARKLHPHLDHIYALSDVKEAIAHREGGHTTGKVGLDISRAILSVSV